MKIRLTSLLLLSFVFIQAQPSNADIHRVLAEINNLRSSGCNCGRNWMPPVRPVKWNDRLFDVSYDYALYLAKNQHFDHVSKEGEDLGDRLNKINFQWTKIGENLGYGYHGFYEVFKAWQESPSHCRMLMDPEMTDMGLSKHKIYWVQSFSKSSEPMASISAY